MFKASDITYYRILKQVLSEASINVEGKAVVLTADAFKWFEELEDKIGKDILKQQGKENGDV